MTEFSKEKYMQKFEENLAAIQKRIGDLYALIERYNTEITTNTDLEHKRKSLKRDIEKEKETIANCDVKITEIQETMDLYQILRQDPAYACIMGQTIPERHFIHINYKKTVSESKVAQLEADLVKTKELIASRQTNAQLQELKTSVTTQIADLKSQTEEIKRKQDLCQNVIANLDAHRFLVDDLDRFLKYTWEKWNEESEDFIVMMLTPENSPFPRKIIKNFVSYVDTLVFGIEDEPDEHHEEISLQDFSKHVTNIFSAELIVAAANTLALRNYWLETQNPESFFEGENGGVEVYTSTSSQGTKSQSVVGTPINKYLDTIMCDHEPEFVKTWRREENGHLKKIFYGFKVLRDGEQRSVQQLYNMERFRKEYWRYGNFYGFDISSQLQIYPEAFDIAACDKAYKAYKKTRQHQGLYMHYY